MWDKAKDCLNQAVSLAEQRYGTDSWYMLIASNDMGKALLTIASMDERNSGDIRAARGHLEKALEVGKSLCLRKEDQK